MGKAKLRSAAKRHAGEPQPGPGWLASGLPNAAWTQRLKELAAFKEMYGHCRVSTLSKSHAGLGNWVRTQRGYRRRGQLSPEQIRVLDAMGFLWEPIKRVGWDATFRALAAYWRANGNCRVPRSAKDRTALNAGSSGSGMPGEEES